MFYCLFWACNLGPYVCHLKRCSTLVNKFFTDVVPKALKYKKLALAQKPAC